MCVICYKHKSKKLPSKEHIERMWNHNHDGAGIMWRTEKGVSFRKGFMKLSDFLEFVDANRRELESTEVAMHFRIGTHGGNTAGNCHPFIVNDMSDMHQLSGDNITDPVLMHNGVLPLVPRRKSISDTAELALRAGRYVNPMDFLQDADELFTGNRVLVFAPNGKTVFLGDAFKNGKDGLLYSNLHSEPFDVSSLRTSSYDWGAWERKWENYFGQRSYKQGTLFTPETTKPVEEDKIVVRDAAASEPADPNDGWEDEYEIPEGWRPPFWPDYLTPATVEEEAAAADAIAITVANAMMKPSKMNDQDWKLFYDSWQADIICQFEDLVVENEASMGV